MKGKFPTNRLLLRRSAVQRHSSTRPWQSFAKYHSYDHPSAPPYSPTAHSILSASLSHVPTYGFTQESLRRGAKDAGYMAISTNLFPRGAFDLIAFYLMTRRLALKDAVNGEEGYAKAWTENEVGIEARVRCLLLERLRMNDEFGVVEKWPEALAVMAQPAYIPQSLAELGKLSDEIWFLVGDTSVDTSWYTKRGSLAALFSAAEVYQTQDKTPGRADTERFVDSRLSDIRAATESVSAVAEWAGFSAHSLLNVLRSKGVRI